MYVIFFYNSSNHRTLNQNNMTIALKLETYYVISCNSILYLILCKFVVNIVTVPLLSLFRYVIVSVNFHGLAVRLSNMQKVSNMTRDGSMSRKERIFLWGKEKISELGQKREEKKVKKDGKEERARRRARAHSFSAVQFQGSSRRPFIPPGVRRWVARATLEMCKSNSLTQRFIRPSVRSRIHAFTRAYVRQTREHTLRAFTIACFTDV